MREFIHTIILAVVLAGLTLPLHSRVAQWIRRPSLAAACTLLILLATILLLLTLFFSAIVPQAVLLARVASALYASGSEAQNSALVGGALGALDGTAARVTFIIERGMASLQSGLDWCSEAVGVNLGNLYELDLSAHVRQLGASIGRQVLTASTAIAGRFMYLAVHLALLFFILYFLLRDGRAMLDWIKRLSPLHHEQELRLLQNLRSVARSVFVGGCLGAVFQGMLAGIGFAIAGLPALVLGMCCILASFVPLVGTALIWAPAAVYLYFSGDVWQAFFLVAWGIFIISGLERLRFFLLLGSEGIPGALLFLAIMGGTSLFGVLGLLYGPLMLTFAIVALNMYMEYATPHDSQESGKTRKRMRPVRKYLRCRA